MINRVRDESSVVTTENKVITHLNSPKITVTNAFGDKLIFKSESLSHVYETGGQEEWEVGLNNGASIKVQSRDEIQKVFDIFDRG